MYQSYLTSSLIIFLFTSFYTLNFTDTEGNIVNCSSFSNKRVLLVNIATASQYTSQLTSLQQLQNQYGDSLVIIAFPSNSFGHEPLNDSAINSFCLNNYNSTFKIAKTNPVVGDTAQSIYFWLQYQSENGVVDGYIARDFQKYLIGRDGKLAGLFAPALHPNDTLILKAIDAN